MGISKNTFIFTSAEDRTAFLEMMEDRNMENGTDFKVHPSIPAVGQRWCVIMLNTDAVEVADACVTEHSLSVDRL